MPELSPSSVRLNFGPMHEPAVHDLCSPRHIVLATLGSLGDLHPIIGLALGLQQRGHEVCVASSEFYRPRIQSLGLRFAPLRPLASPADAQLVRKVMHARSGPEFLFRTLLLPYLREMYDDLAAAIRGADLLIAGEVVLAAPLVAEAMVLPWASVVLAPLSFFSVHDPPVIPPLPFARQFAHAPPIVQRGLHRVLQLATGHWSAPIRELRATLGLPARVQPLFRDRFSPYLNLALFDRVLGAPQPDWPENTQQTGFIYYDSAEAPAPQHALRSFLQAGPPPLVFTLGSTAVLLADDFFEQSVGAARRLGQRALLIMGSNAIPAAPGNDVFACDYAAYSEVFPQAACVIHQGGVGTTAQALRAGVPQLVVPYAFDQPDNAARIVSMGVGLQLARARYRSTPAARQLRRLLSDKIRRNRAGAIGAQVTATDGRTRACLAIEELIRAKRTA